MKKSLFCFLIVFMGGGVDAAVDQRGRSVSPVERNRSRSESPKKRKDSFDKAWSYFEACEIELNKAENNYSKAFHAVLNAITEREKNGENGVDYYEGLDFSCEILLESKKDRDLTYDRNQAYGRSILRVKLEQKAANGKPLTSLQQNALDKIRREEAKEDATRFSIRSSLE